MSKSITFVTGNLGKCEELNYILGNDLPVEIVNRNVDLIEYQGEIVEICKIKCLQAFELVKNPVLVEDTSLCFNALQGLPGPYVKWFFEKIGPEGLFKLLQNYEDKTAEAVSTFAFVSGDSEPVIFQGRVSGVVVAPRGKQGFGFDPCFQPSVSNKTYGEMSREEKSKISHRFKALTQIKKYLRNKFIFQCCLMCFFFFRLTKRFPQFSDFANAAEI